MIKKIIENIIENQNVELIFNFDFPHVEKSVIGFMYGRRGDGLW